MSYGIYDSSTQYGGGFATFCVEESETFVPGTKYDFTKSPNAIYGGNPPGGDPISLGTAWLYSQFALGTLGGYFDASRQTNAGLLQQTIWFLEGETLTNPGGKFIDAVEDKFGSVENASLDANGAYGVVVLNLWDLGYANNTAHRVQDQLFYVPEPGILILLGIAMSAIGAASWRIRKL